MKGAIILCVITCKWMKYKIKRFCKDNWLEVRKPLYKCLGYCAGTKSMDIWTLSSNTALERNKEKVLGLYFKRELHNSQLSSTVKKTIYPNSLFTTHALAPKSTYCADFGSNFANMADQFWLHFFRTYVHDTMLSIFSTVIGLCSLEADEVLMKRSIINIHIASTRP